MKIKENKKRGFTLSEVLITLAIIGVVAALTLPTMIANHQKKVYVVQLQKAISTLEQGFKMMMADDAVDNLDYTSVFQLCANTLQPNGDPAGDCLLGAYDSDEATKQFFDAWKDYFNISEINTIGKDITIYNLNGEADDSRIYNSNDYVIKFADGMWFDMGSGLLTYPSYSHKNEVNNKYYQIMGCFGIDVNGAKGPNTYGRDIFWLCLSSDGTIGGDYGDGTKGTCTSDSYASCVSYLMNNGWVMDY